jgi:hypothetical protein
MPKTPLRPALITPISVAPLASDQKAAVKFATLIIPLLCWGKKSKADLLKWSPGSLSPNRIRRRLLDISRVRTGLWLESWRYCWFNRLVYINLDC